MAAEQHKDYLVNNLIWGTGELLSYQWSKAAVIHSPYCVILVALGGADQLACGRRKSTRGGANSSSDS